MLARYVALRYLLHLVSIAAIMVGLYLAVDAPEHAGRTWAVLGRMPLVLAHVLPLAAGAALLTAFQRMRSAGVLLTLRASGVPWRRILGPAIGAGLLVAGLEAALSLAAAPAALAATAPSQPSRPAWILHDRAAVRVGQGGLRAWRPGEGEVAPPPIADLERDISSLAARVPPDRASTRGLVGTARLEERLGHDSRAEWVELWTRILLPLALVLVLASSAVSVVRGHRPFRSAGRLVVVFAAGWICLAVATHLYASGLFPGWAMLALPLAALAAAAAV